MNFSYAAYRELLNLLKEHNYCFTDYHTYDKYPRCVILRHDIDNSLTQAARMAALEAELGVKSTYFVLLKTDFYNVASQKSQRELRYILEAGHEIGLHFDETAYGRKLSPTEMKECIAEESCLMSSLLGISLTTVSMHRPSKETLESNLEIPNMVNSYGKTFFRDFKYLSDSRRNWREPVRDIIASEDYERLHILTHAFWYHEQEEPIESTISKFVRSAGKERYSQMEDNIRDLREIVRWEDV